MTAQTILPANTLSSGFDVSNSLRFDAASGPYLSRATSGDGNQRKFTFSVWLKMDIHASGATHKIFDHGDATNYFTIYFTAEPYLIVKGRNANSNVLELITNQSFRDPTAWFHLYVAVDTTQGTAANRAKIYINGSQVTALATATYPDQNTDFENQDAGEPFEIGVDNGHASDSHFDGYMAEYMYVDGAVQAISDFGEFDEDSPTVWKPKDISGIDVNPGDDNGNGFYLDFKDSSNLGNDVGVNAGTDFAENNIVALDQSTDVPTNNFSILNPLIYITSAGMTLSEGNLKVVTSADAHRNAYGTMGVSSGKWYWEINVVDTTGDHQKIGVVNEDNAEINKTSPSEFSGDANGYAYRTDGQKENNDSASSYGNSYTDDDIIGVAMDLDNNKLYFSKNGTFQNSGDPTTGSTGTGSAFNLAANKTYFAAINQYGGNTSSFNFGSPPYAISSGNADADGHGNFEFAVPSGYFALCTKNLAEYG